MIDRTITAADFEKVFFTGREYDAEITEAVASIIDDVRKRGDAAVLECTQRYDGVRLTETRVSVAEIKDARQHTPKDMEAIFAEAIKNVTEYHQYQTPKDWFIEKGDGTRLGRVYRPIERVGLYVPGGTASYPSSVIMNAVPAIVAGVPEIVLVSPPSRETGMVARNTLAVADMLGITEIYAVGGAQAVSALAYGTQTIRPVCKITGPGNAYVTEAKRRVFGRVGIDSPAGPSELAVYCDATADPEFVACDMLAQAEHDPLASAVAISTSDDVLQSISRALHRRVPELKRRDCVERSLAAGGYLVAAGSDDEAVKIINRIAPEHLEIVTANPAGVLERINNAGAIFMGPYSPTAAGDYWLGPNHVLPTAGAARYCSGLSVDDFVKASSVIECSRESLIRDGDKIERFAECEGLTAHAGSISVRINGRCCNGR